MQEVLFFYDAKHSFSSFMHGKTYRIREHIQGAGEDHVHNCILETYGTKTSQGVKPEILTVDIFEFLW